MDGETEKTLGEYFGGGQVEKITEACERLGAKIAESKADFMAVFEFLPRYPVTMNLWFADDELQ